MSPVFKPTAIRLTADDRQATRPLGHYQIADGPLSMHRPTRE